MHSGRPALSQLLLNDSPHKIFGASPLPAPPIRKSSTLPLSILRVQLGRVSTRKFARNRWIHDSGAGWVDLLTWLTLQESGRDTDQLAATATARTSHIQSPDTTEVFQILRSSLLGSDSLHD